MSSYLCPGVSLTNYGSFESYENSMKDTFPPVWLIFAKSFSGTLLGETFNEVFEPLERINSFSLVFEILPAGEIWGLLTNNLDNFLSFEFVYESTGFEPVPKAPCVLRIFLWDEPLAPEESSRSSSSANSGFLCGD